MVIRWLLDGYWALLNCILAFLFLRLLFFCFFCFVSFCVWCSFVLGFFFLPISSVLSLYFILFFCSVMRDFVMVRVGGVWGTLGSFLNKLDPCRRQVHHVECHTLESRWHILRTSIHPSIPIDGHTYCWALSLRNISFLTLTVLFANQPEGDLVQKQQSQFVFSSSFIWQWLLPMSLTSIAHIYISPFPITPSDDWHACIQPQDHHSR